MTEQKQVQPSSHTPISQYRALLQADVLQYDSAQNLVIESLQLLSNRLQHYTLPTKAGFMSSLFGKQNEVLKGLYIFGGIGSGKTMLMDLFFASVQIPNKKRYHFSTFMEKIHHDIKEARALSPEDPIQIIADNFIKEATLLCLDEFQVTDITDAMILSRLFEALFSQGLVLVTTGNIAPQNLYAEGLNRALFLPFLDLIALHMDIIELETGKDYRRQGLQEQSLWHIAPRAHENAPYLAQWRKLTAGFTPVPETLRVNGRTLTVPLAAGKIARFRFEDLCAHALGRADYLAIAQKYTTVFIDDIPILQPEQSNEAQRFIVLIDTLYDENITLVASAHGQPDALYKQGKGAEAFKRTASRLLEMRHNRAVL